LLLRLLLHLLLRLLYLLLCLLLRLLHLLLHLLMSLLLLRLLLCLLLRLLLSLFLHTVSDLRVLRVLHVCVLRVRLLGHDLRRRIAHGRSRLVQHEVVGRACRVGHEGLFRADFPAICFLPRQGPHKQRRPVNPMHPVFAGGGER